MIDTRRLALFALTALVLLAPAGSPLRAQVGAKDSVFAITGIQAKLYFPHTGTFSDDMFAVSDLELWNTIIGAGWAGHPSNATLVLVTVSGLSGYPDSLFVELTVTEVRGGAVKLRRRVQVGSLKDGKRLEAFWLYDTGCASLALRAKLIGRTPTSQIEKRIPFRCGE